MKDEKKYPIMFWGDAGFWLSKPDSMEKIEKDAEQLLTEYLNRPSSIFMGIYKLFNDAITTRIFLIRFSALLKRVEKLND